MMQNRYSRRNFLQTAAVSTAMLPACGTFVNKNEKKDRESLNKNPIKIGMMSYMLAAKWDIDTIIKNCTETGYECAELRTTHAHGIEVNLLANQRVEIKKRFTDAGITLMLGSAFYYHSPNKGNLKQNIDGTKEYIKLAHDVGAKSIRVFPNEIPDGIPEDKTLEQIGKSLAVVGEFGYNHGVEVRVCVHGQKTDSPVIIKRIIDHAQSPHVYVNWNCFGKDLEGKGLEYNFNLLKDRIKGVHIHDLWDTSYPYRKLFKLLADSGYQGFCNAEIAGSEDPIRFMKYYKALYMSLQNAY